MSIYRKGEAQFGLRDRAREQIANQVDPNRLDVDAHHRTAENLSYVATRFPTTASSVEHEEIMNKAGIERPYSGDAMAHGKFSREEEARHERKKGATSGVIKRGKRVK